ncbi:MAG: transposase, partial [Candidatus Omnitrophota bacterium]
ALLPDHFHLLLELPAQSEDQSRLGGISEIMHDQNSSYTKYFNGRYNRKGHLFRERFKATLVEKEPYLLQLTAYIHLNPKRLNLVSEGAVYPYSSYVLYIDREVPFKDLIKEEKEEVLGLLSGQTYEEFTETISKELDLNLHKFLQKKNVLGSQRFQEKVKEELERVRKEDEVKAKEEAKGLGLGMKVGIITFGAVLVGSGLTYILRLALKEKAETQEVVQPKLDLKVEEDRINGTEWQIRLITSAGGKEELDFINFEKKKFISGKFNNQGYSASNYTLTIENDKKVIWETMQTGPSGTASWRGEVEEGKMRGIMSLRSNTGETQDFSFISTGYRRKE